MKDLYTFMSESPFLTFFLALILGESAIKISKWIAVSIRGHVPECQKCKKRAEEEDED